MADYGVEEAKTGRAAEKSLPAMCNSDTASTTEATAEPVAGLRGFLDKAATWGRVEIRGIAPIPFSGKLVDAIPHIFLCR
jgi:hypothetical protein